MDWYVTWSESALADAEAAVRQVARRSGAAAAETLRAELFASVGVLTRLPKIGPVYEPDDTGRTREILCRQYRVFYRLAPTERRVNVVLIWHSSRREPRLPA